MRARNRNLNREAFAALWNNHSVPTRRIAAAMGITQQGVSWHAHRMGLPPRPYGPPPRYDPALLSDMWLAGVSSREIAEYFGMKCPSCARSAARSLGLPRRQRGPSGKKNGGWMKHLSIREFWEHRTAGRMAEAAAMDQQERRRRRAG